MREEWKRRRKDEVGVEDSLIAWHNKATKSDDLSAAGYNVSRDQTNLGQKVVNKKPPK